MDINKLCLNCMNEKETEDERCPHCGFLKGEQEQPFHHLPYYTILHGKYLIGNAIGEGGFGITYIGWDLNLNVKIAIKEFYPDGFVGRDGSTSTLVHTYQGGRGIFFEKGKDKFLEEARSLGKFMDLPGIVAVKDFFTENNTVYIVMEYLDGISLKEYARERGGRIERDNLLKIMKPVLESLMQIHENGIIHRDISPDNIMVCKNGSVKLIDFGAAREASPDGERTLSVTLKKGYSPEEQYRTHGEQGSWTDVYSLSATIYAMLTGVKPDEPFDRMEEETLKRPSELGITLSRKQADTLMKGMEIKAKNRLQTVKELYDGLYSDEENSSEESVSEIIETEDTDHSINKNTEEIEQQNELEKLTESKEENTTEQKSTGNGKLAASWCFVIVIMCLLIGIPCYISNIKTGHEYYEDGKFAKAKKAYEKEIENGEIDTEGYYRLGDIYHRGCDVEENVGKAIEYYSLAGENGSSEAFYKLGYIYEIGEGVVEKNEEKAIEYYKRASDLGSYLASSNLLMIYVDRNDWAEAVKYGEKAISLGSENSTNFYLVGAAYHYGLGVSKDYKKAFEYYKKAESKEDWSAINNIGEMYEHGEYVQQDYGKALEYYDKADKLGECIGYETAAENAKRLRAELGY